MRHLGTIILLFAFFLFGGAALHDALTDGAPVVTQLAAATADDDRYAAGDTTSMPCGVEPDGVRTALLLRSQWGQMQQTLMQRTVLTLKRLIAFAASHDSVLTQCRCALWSRRFVGLDASRSLYYVFALRRILI